MQERGSKVRLGWIGTGRMGFSLASRLLRAGCDVAVYNRTRAKAEPLAELGAEIVDAPSDLAGCEIVFTMVAGPDDFKEVLLGTNGLLAGGGPKPRVIVDSTTVSPQASEEVRMRAEEHDVMLLAAPVSGNPNVVDAGLVTFVVSGPPEAHREAEPFFDLLGNGVTYVGEGELARLAKICHNLLLGVVAQSLAEIVVLAEKGGISRAGLMEFINGSVMGSLFTNYKTPAYVKLDFTPTFTPVLLRKDFDLGFEVAHDLDVPMPVSAATLQAVQGLIGRGHAAEDFAILLAQAADSAGLDLVAEDVEVGDGLGPVADMRAPHGAGAGPASE